MGYMFNKQLRGYNTEEVDDTIETLEKKIQELGFDVETQYCDPSDCYHDCYGEGVNNCDAHFTEIW